MKPPPSIPLPARRLFRAATLLLSLLAAPPATASIPSTAVPATPPSSESPPSWSADFDLALQAALAEYKPVLALFTLPDCPWCSRLRAEFSAPSVRPVLDSFILVEIDASSSSLARRHGIRGVPAVLVFSGDGRSRGGFSGFLPAPELLRALSAFVDFSPAESPLDSEAKESFARLAAQSPAPADWPVLARMLGIPDHREAVRQAVFGLDPFPAPALVGLLSSPDLAARLGAIELLEERAGSDLGFDPWSPPSDPSAESLRQPWLDWISSPAASSSNLLYSALGDSRIDSYLLDVLGDDRDRSARAMRMLEAGGRHAALRVADFVRNHPDLAPGLRRRLREVQYAILLHGAPGNRASATAHQIVFGNLDARLRTLAALPESGAGARAVPILQDLLSDENPLVRETACESLLRIAQGSGVVLLAPLLKSETDPNVLYAALRALAQTKSPRAVVALLPFLSHPNEDLVVVALEGLAKLKYSALSPQLAPRLADPRWRVRVAALEAVAALKPADLRPLVAKSIADPDPFVRQAAVSALAAVSDPNQFAADAAPLFRSFPEQRPSIVAAMARNDVPLPPDFVDAIASSPDPDSIVACIAAAADLDQNAFPLAERLALHPHPDVSAAALELLVRLGAKSPAARRILLDALRSRSGDDLASILDSLYFDSDDFQPYASQFRHWFAPGQTPKNDVDPLQALLFAFERFSSASRQPPPTPVPTPASNALSVDDLVAAFENLSPNPAAPSSPSPRSVTLPDLVRELESLSSNSHPRVSFLAALHLVRLGNPSMVPSLMRNLPDRTQAERAEIARALDSVPSPPALVANKSLLADSAAEVRSAAAENLLGNFGGDGLAAIVDELLRPSSPLRPSEIGLRYRTSNVRPAAFRLQSRRLAQSDSTALVALGLLLSPLGWDAASASFVLPFAKSPNPHVRSAAVRALGLRDPASFKTLLPEAARDPSPVVRNAVPFSYFSRDLSEAIPLSDSDSVSLSFDRSPSRPSLPVDDDARAALRSLAEDPNPVVRFRSMLALLDRGETIDASRLAAALDSLPDANRAASDVMSVLGVYGNAKPRPELRALGNALRRHLSDSWWQDRLDKAFGPPLSQDDFLPADVLARLEPDPAPVPFSIAPHGTPATNPPPSLVFFFQPACRECRRVEPLVESMAAYFPGLRIIRRNVRLRDSSLLNEALCDRFGVPQNARLVAPSLFAADGALVGDSISFDSLADLLSRSASREDGRWLEPEPAALAAAEASIRRRYGQSVKTGVVALVALADGVNPCAFATIVFLLSYLHVARRSPAQLLQTGAAFVLGVFLAYFAMGLGLAALLGRVAILGNLARAFNLALAAAVAILGLLSLRDAVLCLRGRIGDMALQLPDSFKRRIREAVRRGARHRLFVPAAFLVGALVAVVELPCTGQAYLPTIAFMVRDPSLRLHALFHLFFYNLLFILPLLVVFALAALGLSHQRLALFLQTRAAAVKFATAALFFALAAAFFFAGS